MITISLISHVTKLVLVLQINYAFMPYKETENVISVLRRLVERAVQKNEDVYICVFGLQQSI